MSLVTELYLSFINLQGEIAQATPPQPGIAEIFSKMMPMFAVVFCIFYFMVISPQKIKMKNQQALLESLKKGDEVVTTSGIVGRVALVEADYITLEISSGVKIKVEKAHIVKKKEQVVSEKSAA